MAGQEVNELQSAQSKKRTLIIAVLVAAVAGAGLTAWLMSGTDRSEYSMGTACDADCGVNRYDGWICLKKQKYCTRPCGENHPKCEEGYSCQQVDGVPATVTKDNSDQRSTYCMR
ncbi:MAG: hypothetical protein ABIJ09_02015 [Pseudomonadota bacterium]